MNMLQMGVIKPFGPSYSNCQSVILRIANEVVVGFLQAYTKSLHGITSTSMIW